MDKFDAIIEDLKNNRQPKIQNSRFCTMDYGYQPTANFPEIPIAPTTGSNAVKPAKHTKKSTVKDNDFEICSCYQTRKERHYLSDFERGVRVGQGKENVLAEDRIVAYCAGTKECEVCKCGGDRARCDFYEETRKKAKAEQKKKDKLKQVFESITMIIDLGFDYDGFEKSEDLKELIDELVSYARKAKMDLREYLKEEKK